MPIVVHKHDQRIKPVSRITGATAWFLTLASRAANWTPWLQKASSERARERTLKKLLEAHRKWRELLKERQEEKGYNPDQPRDERGRWTSGMMNLQQKLLAAKKEVASTFSDYADNIATEWGFTHDKDDEENGWENGGAYDEDTFSRSYIKQYDESSLEERLTLRLDHKENMIVSYSIVGSDSSDAIYDRKFKPDATNKMWAAISKKRTPYLWEQRSIVSTMLNEGGLNKKEEAALRKELSILEKELERSAAKKADMGENEMPGEIVQSIIGPADSDIEELKRLIGDEAFNKLNLKNIMKYDDCVKYIQMDETLFQSLDAMRLGGSEYIIMYGPLVAMAKSDNPGSIDVSDISQKMVATERPNEKASLALKGEVTMNNEEIQAIVQQVAAEAAKAAVDEMVDRAKQDQGSESEAVEQTITLEDLARKLDIILKWISDQTEAAAADQAEVALADEKEDVISKLDEKIGTVISKMDRILRIPTGRADGDQTVAKYDTKNPYAAFDSMLSR